MNTSLVYVGLFVEFVPTILAVVAVVLAIIALVKIQTQLKGLRGEIAAISRERQTIGS